MIVSETNMEWMGTNLMIKNQSRYQVFTTKTSQHNKKKGFEVAIFLIKQIAKHVFKQLECNTYGIMLKLLFKGKHIVNVMGLYYPPETNENK